MKKLLTLGLFIVLCLALPAAAFAAQPNSIVMTGRDAHVPAGTEVANVIVLGGSARIEGRVRESVVVMGGSVYLEPGSQVDEDVVCLGGSIVQTGETFVGGEQVTLGNFSLSNLNFNFGNMRFWGFRSLDYSIWRILSVMFLGWITFWLLPRHVQAIGDAVTSEPTKAVLFGLLSYLAMIPLTILFLITIVGIPLVPVLWMALAAGRLVGQVALGLLAGRWLAPRLNLQVADIYHVLLGLFALGLLTAIPMAGGLAGLFYSLLGFGAVVWTRFGTKPAQQKE